MSGTNPFRRKGSGDQGFAGQSVPVHIAISDRLEAQITSINTDVPRQPKTKTGKTVRIISPHSATSEEGIAIARSFSSPSRSSSSPPPPVSASSGSSDDESAEDPFEAKSDGRSNGAKVEGSPQTIWSHPEISRSEALRQKQTPANPFARTLASINPEVQSDHSNAGNSPKSSGAESKQARPHYDVNDFTKLLLTGEKTTPCTVTRSPPPASFHSQPSNGDTNSNTDASSISRHSIFEPVSGPFHESPRTSHDGSILDEERQQIVGSPPKTSLKTKPATPKHRHGKLVKANSPQTVSFEDPILSFPSHTTSLATPAESSIQNVNRKSVDIENSQPNLPTPAIDAKPLSSSLDKLESGQRLDHGPPDTSESSTPQKRNPPPPPISRRHSARIKQFAASERSVPISEEDLPDTPPLSQSPPMTAQKAPPPPPPRRAGRARGNSSSSVSTDTSMGPTASHSSTNDTTSNALKPRPAPPSSSPTLSGLKRQSTQPFSGSPSMAPPPPPRRRGSSASTNYTPSRLSGNYTAVGERMRSDSGASSISQFQMSPSTSSTAETKDVMADLTALQREVDELRGKFKD